MTTTIFWTDERIATLRQLHAEGHPFSYIGGVLGCSRNAAIGKAGRIGVASRSRQQARQKPRNTPKPKAARQSPACVITMPIFDTDPLPDELPASAVPVGQRKTISELTPAHCRFVYGDPRADYFFCGGLVKPGSSYCPFHHSICWTKSAERWNPRRKMQTAA